MRRNVCYDVTRLLTRILNATPNGIDRVDHALAQHFLLGEHALSYGATCTGIGVRLIPGHAASGAVNRIARHWGETGRAVDSDPIYRRVVNWLQGDGAAPIAEPPKKRRTLPVTPIEVAGWVLRNGIPITRTPRRHLPEGSVYINVSQFPLWRDSTFEWLEQRRDIKSAFFIHDLLPVVMPEYFRASEYERHLARMRNFARFGSAAIVTTKTVATNLHRHMSALGRDDVPIFAAATPMSLTFATPREVDPMLRHPFFVFCSTLEPRKNHLMILAVWRALVDRFGNEAPKLVLVGTRGWHYDPIVDLVERSPALRRHVIEVGGLSTPGLKRLIDNAQALLMPSFGEGYGLPVYEALAAGAPVIASDIPAFREIAAGGLTLLSPLDGEAWLETITARFREPRPDSFERHVPQGWASYFARLDTFIDAL